MTQLFGIQWNRRRSVVRMGCVALAATAVLAPAAAAKAMPTPQVKAVAASAIHHSNTSKLRDPRRNVKASPDYLYDCAADGSNNRTCLNKSLTAINNARAAEGIKSMVLPNNYLKLTIPEQTFVVTNIERVDRGLRPFIGLTDKLNANAHHAAVVRDDPTLIGALMSLLGIREYGSIWAGDFGPLASDYDWMYNDGYSAAGSVNLDCTTPSASGCWGHRHCILGIFTGLQTLIAGGGTSKPVGSSIAEVLAGSLRSASSFSYSFTWQQALAHGADGHKVTA